LACCAHLTLAVSFVTLCQLYGIEHVEGLQNMNSTMIVKPITKAPPRPVESEKKSGNDGETEFPEYQESGERGSKAKFGEMGRKLREAKRKAAKFKKDLNNKEGSANYSSMKIALEKISNQVLFLARVFPLRLVTLKEELDSHGYAHVHDTFSYCFSGRGCIRHV
jgi:hypothetical protein